MELPGGLRAGRKQEAFMHRFCLPLTKVALWGSNFSCTSVLCTRLCQSGPGQGGSGGTEAGSRGGKLLPKLVRTNEQQTNLHGAEHYGHSWYERREQEDLKWSPKLSDSRSY